MTLSERMLHIRAECGISQQTAAEMCGVTRQTWCNVERGLQDPSRVTKEKIKTLLDRLEERRW